MRKRRGLDQVARWVLARKSRRTVPVHLRRARWRAASSAIGCVWTMRTYARCPTCPAGASFKQGLEVAQANTHGLEDASYREWQQSKESSQACGQGQCQMQKDITRRQGKPRFIMSRGYGTITALSSIYPASSWLGDVITGHKWQEYTRGGGLISAALQM